VAIAVVILGGGVGPGIAGFAGGAEGDWDHATAASEKTSVSKASACFRTIDSSFLIVVD
jgi:hypothetical protein